LIITNKTLHFKNIFFVLICFTCHTALSAQILLDQPIQGASGKDFIIVNYVDWGVGNTVKDALCGSKTYNGHQGTDFVIRNFKQMDSGINVLAAADGVVTFVQDGFFDKETAGDTAKKLGNYICIAHANKYYTYYGHLKKNSIVVNAGDTVKSGKILAKVGSSGNSTDPHLHMELWYDSSIYIDPFSGTCGNSQSSWANPLPYDTSFALWISGISKDSLNIAKLREQPLNFTQFTDSQSIVSYWNLMYGIRAGDSVIVDWYTPDNELWFSYGYKNLIDYWYYHYYTFIDVPKSGKQGLWTVKLRINSSIKDTKTFMYTKTSGIKALTGAELNIYQNNGFLEIKNEGITEVSLYNIKGELQAHQLAKNNNIILATDQLPKGIYVLTALGNNQYYSKKILID